MNRIIIAVTLTFVIALITSSAFAHRWCFATTRDNTYGWQLMTPEERKEHQARLVKFSRYTTCKEYIEAHHKKKAERAVEKGVGPPAMKRNSCDIMKAEGTLE